MSYSKKIWVNRNSQYPNRYRMTSQNGNVADVAIVPNEGNITEEGDKFDADTMNNMESRIKSAFDSSDSAMSTLNTTLRGLITAEQTRAVGIENLLRHDVDENANNISSEVTRAQNAETALGTRITNETTRAQDIETGLRQDVIVLQNDMDNAESDIGTLTTRIATLEQDIELETDRAKDAETELAGNITSEVTRAEGAETVLQTNITNEVDRATSAENTLGTSITNEIARATEAEAVITASLNEESSRAQQAESDLHDYVDQKIATTYKPSGSIYFADLPALTESRVGNVYNIKDAFTTTADFVEGAGHKYPIGTNIGIQRIEKVNYTEVEPTGEENPTEEVWYELVNDEYVLSEDTEVDETKTYYVRTDYVYYYDVMAGFIDTSHFITDTDYATLTNAGIVKPDGTTVVVDENGVLSSLGGGQGSAEAAERMIAPIEPDATASTRTYTVGQRLILNEVLYKAKTAIAIGDELVIGTNIEASDDVSTQIDDANAELQKSYKTDDSASTTINNTDYVPMLEGTTKKKTLWSTIVAKIKIALGIESSGSTYLKKDGTWGTPANTTYSLGSSGEAVKLTPSSGSAESVNLSTLINGLSTGTSTPSDNDYYVSQYAGGGTTTTSYHRRPVSALWDYIKGKIGISSGSTYLKKDGTWGTPTYSDVGAAPASHTHNYAGSSSAGGAANSADKLNNIYSSRPTSANVQFGDGALRVFKATSSMTTGKPTIGDAHILDFAWDNSGGYDAQIAVGTDDGMQFRYQSGGTWKDWRTLIHSGNIGSQSVNYANSSGSALTATSASKIGSSTVGSDYRPVYISSGVPTQCATPKSGSYFKGVPYIAPDGLMEIGRYIDFHPYDGSTVDFNVRLDAGSGTTARAFTFPSSGGELALNSKFADYLPLSGGTMTGNINMGGKYLYNSSLIYNTGTLQLQGQQYLNLRSPGIQCRNAGDSGWAGISASAFTTQSSKRYKDNIENISEEEAIKLLDVRVVKYDYKENVTDEKHRYNQHGVIAEEVVDILPEVVTYAIPYGKEEEYYEPVPDSVDYAKFTPYLIKIVQMQQREINTLRTELDELKTILKRR